MGYYCLNQNRFGGKVHRMSIAKKSAPSIQTRVHELSSWEKVENVSDMKIESRKFLISKLSRQIREKLKKEK